MSLKETYDTDNIFARIIKGEIPSVKIHEDDEVLSFMDAFPQTRGHTLVIPKKAQATNLLTVDPDVLSMLIQRTQMIAKAIDKALAPDGIRIAQFNGAPAGQSVFHIHFHIIPVWEGGAMKPHADPASGMADPKALEEIAAEIRAAL
ncbi:HIT family protein [Parvularcula flava]|uniref:HIT family protein n=1 Tax=Aquisalinus luteolus TaxID=1566827 RepID=A0A8J3A2J1_9PROT|nr:HIT family protein [Aquisalinus luteolus]NHK27356.1 HIT family protein [Aquisalinus luteolus]GGH95186.1 hydrolase [Aquisalinus luteolus]